MRLIKTGMAALLTGVAIAGFTHQSSPLPESADYIYVGIDQAESGRLLAKALEGLGKARWEVKVLGDGNVLLHRKQAGRFEPAMVLQSKPARDELDRIAAYYAFGGRPGNRSDLKALQFVNKLNATISGTTFAIAENGSIVAESVIDFRNVLEGRDLLAFIEGIDATWRLILSDEEDNEAGIRKYFLNDGKGRPDLDTELNPSREA